jgi:hypothetical protein
MKTVYLDEIENPTERKILNLLNDKGSCLYGDVFKELSISANEGQHMVFSLLSRGLIKFQYHSSKLELNVKIK